MFQAAAWGIWDGWDGYLTIMGAVMALHLLSAQLQCGCCDGTTLQFYISHMFLHVLLHMYILRYSDLFNVFAFGTHPQHFRFWYPLIMI